RFADRLDLPLRARRHRAEALAHLPQDHAAHAVDRASIDPFLEAFLHALTQAPLNALRIALAIAGGLSSHRTFGHVPPSPGIRPGYPSPIDGPAKSRPCSTDGLRRSALSRRGGLRLRTALERRDAPVLDHQDIGDADAEHAEAHVQRADIGAGAGH